MDSRKIFHDSVVPLPSAGGGRVHDGMIITPAAQEHGDEPMDLVFALAIAPDAAARLEDKVARGEVVEAGDLHAGFAVPREKADALAAWLTGQGFQVTGISRDGASVYARATASQVQQSLAVSMVRVTRDGFTYTAAQNAPSLPADVGEPVHAIVGLQPFRRAHKHGKVRVLQRTAAAPEQEAGTAATAAPHQPPYMVQDLLGAYGAASAGVTGAGQTIAVLINTVPLDSDLQAFWERNGIPVNLERIQTVNVSGVTLPPPQGEETIDVEWASGVARDANIRIYATGSLNYPSLFKGLDQILEDLPSQPGMRQLSISMGMGETYMTGGEVAAQHQRFLKLAAAGVNVFVSSGDAGSNPDNTGHASAGPTQAEYGSSDPAVVGVGGTQLKLAPDGTVAEETGWAGSGGGKSILFSRPAWQSTPNVPGTQRLVPDVSLVADPGTGAFLVFHGTVGEVGGTSWATPVWAAFCALINEARSKAGKPALPFLNPLLYPLAGTPSLRDITQGSNGAYDAGPGYDMVTGLGVPDVGELIRALP